MIRDKKEEQRERISVKTLDKVFTKEIEEGLNCSPFESKAILQVVKEVYLPWLNSTHSMHPGQMMVMGVRIEEPPGKPIKDCKMGIAVITYDAGEEDQKIRRSRGIPALRRHRMLRIAKEAKEQGILLTLEDFAYKIFNCGYRTACRDLEWLREKGAQVPLRSEQKDIGRSLTHRVKAVELYMERKSYTQIARQMSHSLEAVKNYLNKFTRVVALTELGHSVAEIAFVVQISSYLVKEYQNLLERYRSECPERLDELLEEFCVKKNRIADLVKRK